eukprot:PhM_4_TR6719/c0_g1_i1/m.103201
MSHTITGYSNRRQLQQQKQKHHDHEPHQQQQQRLNRRVTYSSCNITTPCPRNRVPLDKSLVTSLTDAVQAYPHAYDASAGRLSLAGRNICSLGRGIADRRILSGLTHLYLADNRIDCLEVNDKNNLSRATALRVVSLSGNRIARVSELKGLATLFPKSVQMLSLEGNPVTAMPFYRYHVIAAMPSLRTLDGVDVTPSERQDAPGVVRKEAAYVSALFAAHLWLLLLRNCRDKMAMHRELRRRCRRFLGQQQQLSPQRCVSTLLRLGPSLVMPWVSRDIVCHEARKQVWQCGVIHGVVSPATTGGVPTHEATMMAYADSLGRAQHEGMEVWGDILDLAGDQSLVEHYDDVVVVWQRAVESSEPASMDVVAGASRRRRVTFTDTEKQQQTHHRHPHPHRRPLHCHDKVPMSVLVESIAEHPPLPCEPQKQGSDGARRSDEGEDAQDDYGDYYGDGDDTIYSPLSPPKPYPQKHVQEEFGDGGNEWQLSPPLHDTAATPPHNTSSSFDAGGSISSATRVPPHRCAPSPSPTKTAVSAMSSTSSSSSSMIAAALRTAQNEISSAREECSELQRTVLHQHTELRHLAYENDTLRSRLAHQSDCLDTRNGMYKTELHKYVRATDHYNERLIAKVFAALRFGVLISANHTQAAAILKCVHDKTAMAAAFRAWRRVLVDVSVSETAAADAFRDRRLCTTAMTRWMKKHRLISLSYEWDHCALRSRRILLRSVFSRWHRMTDARYLAERFTLRRFLLRWRESHAAQQEDDVVAVAQADARRSCRIMQRPFQIWWTACARRHAYDVVADARRHRVAAMCLHLWRRKSEKRFLMRRRFFLQWRDVTMDAVFRSREAAVLERDLLRSQLDEARAMLLSLQQQQAQQGHTREASVTPSLVDRSIEDTAQYDLPSPAASPAPRSPSVAGADVLAESIIADEVASPTAVVSPHQAKSSQHHRLDESAAVSCVSSSVLSVEAPRGDSCCTQSDGIDVAMATSTSSSSASSTNRRDTAMLRALLHRAASLRQRYDVKASQAVHLEN